MAQTHNQPHAETKHGSDMGAAFAGLIIGAIAIFLILGGVVTWTNRHYASEKTATETSR